MCRNLRKIKWFCMKLEVLNNNGKVVEYTEFKECINVEKFKCANSAGYKFKLNGKMIPYKKIKEFMES